jgi:hypothetical protein
MENGKGKRRAKEEGDEGSKTKNKVISGTAIKRDQADLA